MLLSRFWYVVLALLLGVAAFVLFLAVSMYNRAGARAMGEALSSDSPVVVDAICDPEIPPLPPHTTWEQSMAMMSALMKGDPAAGKIVKNSFKGKMAELVH